MTRDQIFDHSCHFGVAQGSSGDSGRKQQEYNKTKQTTTTTIHTHTHTHTHTQTDLTLHPTLHSLYKQPAKPTCCCVQHRTVLQKQSTNLIYCFPLIASPRNQPTVADGTAQVHGISPRIWPALALGIAQFRRENNRTSSLLSHSTAFHIQSIQSFKSASFWFSYRVCARTRARARVCVCIVCVCVCVCVCACVCVLCVRVCVCA